MKRLIMALFTVLITTFSCSANEPLLITEVDEIEIQNPCPDEDVWVYIKHQASDDWEWHPPCVVIVHIPKHTLEGDFENCPAQPTEVLGKGQSSRGFAGMHVVELKKGHLNNPKNYTTRPPKSMDMPADNIRTWHVKLW
jgi:hypothetical protein